MKGLPSSVLVVLAVTAFAAGPAAAQPLGSYRWQLQPYCNVITLAVVQQGGQYQLDGIDDQCGAGQAASVRGMAFPNPNGTIGFGLTVVTAPGGTAVHIDATISFPGLNGTWRDSAGNSGNFIFGAGIPGGSPRPVPPGGLAPASVTTIQIAPAAVTHAQIAADAVTGANVVNGSIATADLAAPPLQAGTLASSGGTTLTGSSQTIRTVTLTIPSNGTVVANTSGMFYFSSAATTDTAWCSITTGTLVEGTHYLLVGERTPDALTYSTMAGTRFFNVTAGSFTVRLVCLGYSGSSEIYSPILNAIFIPTP